MRKFVWLLALVILTGCGEEKDEVIKEEVKEENTGSAGRITWGKDGAEMALIPAGSFEMGDHFSEGDNDELPIHTVELDAFYMDIHEVSVGRYRRFLAETHDALPDWVPQYSPTDEHPVVGVDWNNATAYAKWTGKRLPTEAEWEYAARGGLVGKRYPWEDKIGYNDANYRGIGGKDKWKSSCAPVGSFDPNGYGLFDMGGNAWEWCADLYSENYYEDSPTKNPLGPSGGLERVLRGGSWSSDTTHLRVANRNFYDPLDRLIYLGGFRCVSSSDNP